MIDSILIITKYLVGTYLFLLFGWVLYLGIMNLARVKDKLHPFAKFNAMGILYPVGLVIDLMINLFFCAILLRVPHDWLFTGTLKRMKREEKGWRYSFAVWVCEHLLNQFDPKGNHC